MGIAAISADSDFELCRKVVIAVLALMACSMQIAPAKSYYFPATAKRV
jgi:hypothetical protein